VVSVPLLRNIQIQYYKEFFKAHEVPNTLKKLTVGQFQSKYYRIAEIITEELSKADSSSFTEEELDDFLFNELFFFSNNYHYALRFNHFLFSKDSSIESVVDFLQRNGSFKFNNLLSNETEAGDLKILTTRVESIDGKLTKMNFLIRIQSISTRRFPDVHFLCGIQIDVTNNLILFKFQLNHLEKSKMEPLDVLTLMKKFVNGESREGQILQPLQINVVTFNEYITHKSIFSMFEELSLEAEKILNAQTKPNTVSEITNFLVSMGVRKVEEDYIEQIKAVIYQEISTTINDNTFEKGWVFRFKFKEGLTTSASSRTEDYGPIYGSKIYWHLKELIFKEKKMYEGGFHWYIHGIESDQFVHVRLEAKNDTMVINYYRKMRQSRKEKEDFVQRKVNEHLLLFEVD